LFRKRVVLIGFPPCAPLTLGVIDRSVSGAFGSEPRLMKAVLLSPPAVPVIPTDANVSTGLVVTAKLAALFPARTVTLAGTWACAGSLLSRATTVPPVPAGTETGTRIRLKGQGGSPRPGEPPGDLLVTFQVQPDRFFHRDGLDLVCEVPINVAQAALGTRLRVRTLDGKKVVLKVPAGTQPGRKFRIKGLGLEKGGRRGDQLVQVQVEVPERLTAEQEELFKKFAEATDLRY